MKTIYDFDNFIIEYDIEKQLVITKYPDGSECNVWPNENDKHLSVKARITPLEYKLLHELAHHYVAFAYGHDTCPIVRAQALLHPMPDNAPFMEFQIMGISAMVLEMDMENPTDWDAIEHLAKVASIWKMKENISNLMVLSEGVEWNNNIIKPREMRIL